MNCIQNFHVANILLSNRFLADQMYSTIERYVATDGLTPRNVNGRKKLKLSEGEFHKEKRIQYFSQANTET